jgi:tetratricopeptide (TPR) repeat protein
MAAKNRDMNIDIGLTWYRMGQQQLMAGDTKGAIESFRNATTNDHDNSEYTLALATALAAGDHIEEARQALLRLRTSAPENGEINLNLARLAAKESKIPEAERFYHNALFGTWRPDQMSSQRARVRTELVELLLSHGDTSQALSELLILSSDIPNTEEAHNKVGFLFLEAGDSQHAMEEFSRTLQLNGKNANALTGAGQANFNLAEYGRAHRFLEAAVTNGSNSQEVMRLLETSRLVLLRDPLASGIASEERIRRLKTDLDLSSDELQSCLIKKHDDQSAVAVLEPLSLEIEQGMQTQFRPQVLRRDLEGITAGVNLIRRSELAAGQICSESSSLRSALLLIARKHGVGEQ